LVRDGYREASLPYKETREESLVKLPVFTHFVDLLPFYPDLGQDGHDIFASLAAGPAPTSVLSSSPSSSFQREMRQQASDNVVLELGCGCGTTLQAFIHPTFDHSFILYFIRFKGNRWRATSARGCTVRRRRTWALISARHRYMPATVYCGTPAHYTHHVHASPHTIIPFCVQVQLAKSTCWPV
jgi:hypothetical protein